MKISKKQTEKGLYVVITASIEDMYEADLMKSFTRNQIFSSGFQDIQSGRLINYFNNLLVTSAINDGDMVLLSAESPKYRIIGDNDKFVEFHFFYPRAGKNTIKSGSDDFKPNYQTPFGNRVEQPDGWDYSRMKSDK
jgi:hypothetical protein